MTVQRKRILLAGLDPVLATELSQHLNATGCEVTQSAPMAQSQAEESSDADLIFLQTGQPGLMDLLSALSHGSPGVPVVVVSRLPEVSDWLDAMEAGAADYCAAPFDREQIGWILESNLKSRAATAA